jgi:hypothetical protein
MTTVFTLPPWRKVHDINVKSSKGHRFTIDIYQDFNQGQYETTVTVFDTDPTLPGVVYTVQSAGPAPPDHLKTALEKVRDYLKQVDPTDAIADIHNPCNCPFVSKSEQEQIASSLGITVLIRVN